MTSQRRVFFNGLLNLRPDTGAVPARCMVLHVSAFRSQQTISISFLLSGVYDAQGRCNTFVISKDDDIFLRTNERYDTLLPIYEANTKELQAFISSGNRGRKKLESKHRLSVKGLKGRCVLRPLKYFDVGSSFAVDTLHNVYLGAFVSSSLLCFVRKSFFFQRRLLNMWFSSSYRNEQWSIHDQIHRLAKRLNYVLFPSTTTRRPRSLLKFGKYKGNELRSLLLFAYSIFDGVLPRQFYSHLLILVLIMHKSESRSLRCDALEDVQSLCASFVLSFPILYSSRHNVQVIHSVIHISSTVTLFGPLQNYSTFNFENLLGAYLLSPTIAENKISFLLHLCRACHQNLQRYSSTCY